MYATYEHGERIIMRVQAGWVVSQPPTPTHCPQAMESGEGHQDAERHAALVSRRGGSTTGHALAPPHAAPSGPTQLGGHVGCCMAFQDPSPSPPSHAHRRLEYKPHLIRWEDVKCEAGAGKHFIYPAADKLGRPIVMMRPRWAPRRRSEEEREVV